MAETETPTIKSDYAPLLNALHDMSQSLLYAGRKHHLISAETVILRLERELSALKAENAALRKDAERYRWLVKHGLDWQRRGKP